MPLKNYGVLKAKAIDSQMGKSHYQVLVEDENEVKYRIAINVKSEEYPSEVLYFIDEDFKWKNIDKLLEVKAGFSEIKNNSLNIALDYIRGGLFEPSKMIPLASRITGPNNDLNEKIDFYMQKAIQNGAVIYAYGENWGPENKSDEYFKFEPSNGIHDIHMNQGNTDEWEKDNGIWQDGGMIIYFENENKWIGIFLAFQSQSWCTYDNGNAIRPVSECNHMNSKNCGNITIIK
ncbi:YukJ family protein [uncultured Clostridium sp.]|uniref:YukJ family protein n=1 Tax=uncultured Clostridium sp. TaxID=59620 RepID=UPI0028EE76A2|nr:YukJ family protein [uncultured Clostridium sp.]